MFDIEHYLNPTTNQEELLREYGNQLGELNRQFNLVSRESAKYIAERHILHSLAIAIRKFPAGSRIVDFGTGGGLPGIPLAICFPDATFYLIDSIGKKVRAVNLMIRRLGLPNVEAIQTRAEEWGGAAEYAVSRATAPLLDLWNWFSAISVASSFDVSGEYWNPGLVCLKGGNLEGEITDLHKTYPALKLDFLDLYPILKQSYFQEKQLVTVSAET